MADFRKMAPRGAQLSCEKNIFAFKFHKLHIILINAYEQAC